MAARVCLEHLSAVDDGFHWASQAVERAKSEQSSLSSRWALSDCVFVTIIAYIFDCWAQVFPVQRISLLHQVAPESDWAAQTKLDGTMFGGAAGSVKA